MTSIDVSAYLSDSEMKEIVATEVREQIAEALRDERRVSNLMYEVAQEQINETMSTELGNGWRKRLIVKAAEAMDDKESLRFFLMRTPTSWDKTQGPAIEPIKQAVQEHTGLLSNRVATIIDDLDSADLGDVLYEALARVLRGDNNE